MCGEEATRHAQQVGYPARVAVAGWDSAREWGWGEDLGGTGVGRRGGLQEAMSEIDSGLAREL